MNLYEIDRKLNDLIEQGFTTDCIDLETGEINEQKIQEYLDTLPIERSLKLENYGLIIKNCESDIKAIKDEEEKLKERRKAKEKKMQFFKDSLTNSLLKFNDTKFESAKVVLSLRKSESVEVENIENLPQKYIVVKTTSQADKKALTKAIKGGEIIDGVTLVEKQNLQIK